MTRSCAPRSLVALATTALIATAMPAEGLDLGKSVRDATKSVGSALGGGSGGGSDSSSSNSSSLGTSASVGSGPGGRLKASVNSGLLGGTSLDVNLLDQSGVANIGAANGGTDTNAGVGVLSRGQLVSLGLDADTSIGGGSSNGSAPGGITPDFARALLASLDRLEKQRLRLKCRDVLRSPKAFDAELILLCKIVASL